MAENRIQETTGRTPHRQWIPDAAVAETILQTILPQYLGTPSSVPLIRELQLARLQDDATYNQAVSNIVADHFESGALETALHALGEETRKNIIPLSLMVEQDYVGNIYHAVESAFPASLYDLAEIPADAPVPAALSRIITLAREYDELTRAAFFSGAQQDSYDYELMNEAIALHEQGIDLDTITNYLETGQKNGWDVAAAGIDSIPLSPRFSYLALAAQENMQKPAPPGIQENRGWIKDENAALDILNGADFRLSLPPQSTNPLIQNLIDARAQGPDSYAAAVHDAIATSFSSGALENALHDLGTQTRRHIVPLPDELSGGYAGYYTTAPHYAARLAAIPADYETPPELDRIIFISRLYQGNADPANMPDNEQKASFQHDFAQEAILLQEQGFDVNAYLTEHFPTTQDNVIAFAQALPSVTWNNPGIVVEGIEQFAADTIGLFGDIADIADAKLNNNLGISFKNLAGHQGISYGNVVSEKSMDLMNFFTGKAEIRNKDDEIVLSGVTTTADIASIFLGGAGLVKAGVKKSIRKGVDDAADVIADASRATPKGTLSSTFNLTEKADMSIKANALKRIFGEASEAPLKTTGYLGATMTRGQYIGSQAFLTAAPLVVAGGLATAEVLTGGAVSQAAMDTAISGIRAGIKSGVVDAHNLESSIDAIGFITEISNALDKSAQNGTVNAVLLTGSPDSPETIARAQSAAIGWLLKPDNSAAILAAHGVRSQLVDDVITDPAAADRYLAEKFIDDIVNKAQVNALGDNNITRDHVHDHLREVMSDPESRLGAMIKDTRLGDGLQKIWPDLAAAPAAESASPSANFNNIAQNTPFTPTVTKWQQGLSDISSSLQNIHGLAWLSPVISLIASLVGLIAGLFTGKDVVAQSDNPERLSALGALRADDANPIRRFTHDGHSAPAIVPAPHETRPLPPQFTPGAGL